MPTEFLTDAQERACGHYVGPPSNQQLAGYFHLEDADLDLVNVRSGSRVDHRPVPGHVPDRANRSPAERCRYVSAQLAIHDAASLAEFCAR